MCDSARPLICNTLGTSQSQGKSILEGYFPETSFICQMLLAPSLGYKIGNQSGASVSKGNLPSKSIRPNLFLISLWPSAIASASPLNSLSPICISQVDLKPSEYTASACVLALSLTWSQQQQPKHIQCQSPPPKLCDCPLSLCHFPIPQGRELLIKEKRKPAIPSCRGLVCLCTHVRTHTKIGLKESSSQNPKCFPAVALEECCIL